MGIGIVAMFLPPVLPAALQAALFVASAARMGTLAFRRRPAKPIPPAAKRWLPDGTSLVRMWFLLACRGAQGPGTRSNRKLCASANAA
ncbi:hypothetical protein OOZ19_25240 [Saccharopolyspora sp. NFXS83]|uniref:hypothetical protein n=1 Tax=Saccharopolyspora sp. NFXS83 TaxID=2993560 RepID=UPI00224ACDC4|nr:hypothetical protein [Saccharopolyspora sp. NFXS83]MCX2733561.1 hypothetical protein [Saccharopolyspora sp. NFXS83]